jgi:hypothetical protein
MAWYFYCLQYSPEVQLQFSEISQLFDSFFLKSLEHSERSDTEPE